MKSILTALFSFVISLSAIAQISDDDARRLYDEAEQQYEAQSFYQCYQLCMDLKEKMGKHTPKTLYLMLKAIYNSLENGNEKSKVKINKSYENYNRFFSYSNTFFTLVDKKTYPEQKLKEIETIHEYFQKGMSAYEHQKGRRPEDAVAFLNECARKFPQKKLLSNEIIISNTTVFTLDGSFLRIIETRQVKDDNFYLSNFVIFYVRTTCLDFSKITGIISVNKGHRYITYYNGTYSPCNACTSWGFTGIDEKGKIPELGENKMPSGNGIVLSNRWASKRYSNNGKRSEWVKKSAEYLYEDTSVAPSIAFTDWKTVDEMALWQRYKVGNGDANLYFLTTPTEEYNGTLFDQTNAEFKEGDYERRIIEAFQFLVDYFPKSKGPNRKENRTEVKSKF